MVRCPANVGSAIAVAVTVKIRLYLYTCKYSNNTLWLFVDNYHNNNNNNNNKTCCCYCVGSVVFYYYIFFYCSYLFLIINIPYGLCFFCLFIFTLRSNLILLENFLNLPFHIIMIGHHF